MGERKRSILSQKGNALLGVMAALGGAIAATYVVIEGNRHFSKGVRTSELSDQFNLWTTTLSSMISPPGYTTGMANYQCASMFKHDGYFTAGSINDVILYWPAYCLTGSSVTLNVSRDDCIAGGGNWISYEYLKKGAEYNGLEIDTLSLDVPAPATPVALGAIYTTDVTLKITAKKNSESSSFGVQNYTWEQTFKMDLRNDPDGEYRPESCGKEYVLPSPSPSVVAPSPLPSPSPTPACSAAPKPETTPTACEADPVCTTIGLGANQSLFCDSGAVQSYTVPATATSCTAKIWGAGGGSGSNYYGGGAGYAEFTFNVISSGTPTSDEWKQGETLSIVVGRGGETRLGGTAVTNRPLGGYPDGGNGGAALWTAPAGEFRGGGGGSSSILRGTTSLIIAGGGGGGGGVAPNGGAGGPGGGAQGFYAGVNCPNDGKGGSQTAPGDGGVSALGTATTMGQTGVLKQGGQGSTDGASGGGGGGYFGGGGGGHNPNEVGGDAGGGGGSSYIPINDPLRGKVLAGSDNIPGNASDADYAAFTAGAGRGAVPSSTSVTAAFGAGCTGKPGRVFISCQVPAPAPSPSPSPTICPPSSPVAPQASCQTGKTCNAAPGTVIAPAGSGSGSQTFCYNGTTQADGSEQDFAVPNTGPYWNNTVCTVKLWGGGGGAGGHYYGGGGGFVKYDMPVLPAGSTPEPGKLVRGEVVKILVAGGGDTRIGGNGAQGPAGGYGGGGTGGLRGYSGGYEQRGGGGGRSALRRAGEDLLTAGGGGGGGSVHPYGSTHGGGGGGISGFDGGFSCPLDGKGGTQTAGGAGGSGLTNGGAGSKYQGGYGSLTTGDVGGGGGGWYGGGGAGHSAGVRSASAGGGSSYAPMMNASTTQAGSAPNAGGKADPDYADNAGNGAVPFQGFPLSSFAQACTGNPGRVVIKCSGCSTHNWENETPEEACPTYSCTPGAIDGGQRFCHTGAIQSYTVPAGATKCTAKVWGGGGGGTNNWYGGGGGYAQRTFNVSGGTALTLIVAGGGQGGGGGMMMGGFGGGGNSGNKPAPNEGRGAGGGRSAIRLPDSTEVVTAGGGGGAGGWYPYGHPGGPGGGDEGGADSHCPWNGKGGTQTSGGAGGGGVGSCSTGVSGSQFQGGNGGTCWYGNEAGGGGGYFGGGGGGAGGFGMAASNGSGGGGSGYAPGGINLQALEKGRPPMSTEAAYVGTNAARGGVAKGSIPVGCNGTNGIVWIKCEP